MSEFEDTIPHGPERLETVKRLSRDLLLASITLSDAEARFLVDAYYIIQDDRKRSNSQVRTLDESKEPHLLLSWFAEQNRVFEAQIKNALDRYSLSKPVGAWLQSICAVGPVISAGMLAHIDITKAPTVGHVWRYAGLDPTRKWEKKQKRPFNADFKVLCYKTGESFVKFQNHPKDVYGKFFVKQKDKYVTRNISMQYKEKSAHILKTKDIDKKTDAYKHYSVGMLPPAHIHAMARRWVVKLFLSHVHYAMYVNHYGEEPPFPYAMDIMGHDFRHFVPGPDFAKKT